MADLLHFHDPEPTPDAVVRARRLLAAPPPRREPVWRLLAAATLAASAALALAAAVILGPPQGMPNAPPAKPAGLRPALSPRL